MICSWFFGDVFMICFMIFSWFECRDTFPANSQPSLPLLDVLAIFRWFFIDFLSSEGRSPEARRRSHAEVAGKAVSFLLRISYIFHNFPLLSFCSPRFPFLLLQVYRNTNFALVFIGLFWFWGLQTVLRVRLGFCTDLRVWKDRRFRSFGLGRATSFSPSGSTGSPLNHWNSMKHHAFFCKLQ